MIAGNRIKAMNTPYKPHDDLIDCYLTYLHHIHRAPRTIETYREILGRAHRGLSEGLPSANTVELVAWLGTNGWKPGTRQLYTIAIKRFFGWCVAGGYLDYDPAAGLERPRKPRLIPRPATPGQVATIVGRAREPVWIWSVIAAYSGARACEIATLDRGDFTEEAIRIRGKGSSERLVPTHADLWAVVRDLPPGPITTTPAKAISARAHREFRRIGVLTSLHKLRGYFATELRRAGVDVEVIRQLLGHSSLNTTQAYLGTDVAELAAAVGRLPTVSAAPAGVAAAG